MPLSGSCPPALPQVPILVTPVYAVWSEEKGRGQVQSPQGREGGRNVRCGRCPWESEPLSIQRWSCRGAQPVELDQNLQVREMNFGEVASERGHSDGLTSLMPEALRDRSPQSPESEFFFPWPVS